MKSIGTIVFVAGAVASSGCSPKMPASAAPDVHVVQLRDAVARNLRDPSSAQFRDEHIYHHGTDVESLCGELNAKNALGGYVGFRKFVVISPSKVFIDPAETGFEEQAFGQIWSTECRDSGAIEHPISLEAFIQEHRPTFAIANIALDAPVDLRTIGRVLGVECNPKEYECSGLTDVGGYSGKLTVSFGEDRRINQLRFLSSSATRQSISNSLRLTYGDPDLPATDSNHMDFWLTRGNTASVYSNGGPVILTMSTRRVNDAQGFH